MTHVRQKLTLGNGRASASRERASNAELSASKLICASFNSVTSELMA